MNTTLQTTMERTLHQGTTHPPDTGDRQILTIPDTDEQRRLSPAERLAFRVGLWLLQRGIQAVDREERADTAMIQRAIHEREALALLAFEQHRRLL